MKTGMLSFVGVLLLATAAWANAPFTPDARIEVVTAQGVRVLPVPTTVAPLSRRLRRAGPPGRCFNDDGGDVVPVALQQAGVSSGRMAVLAIETDQEFRALFATDDEAVNYLGALLTAVQAIYVRDFGVEFGVSYARLWDTTDPWVAGDPGGTLAEFVDYWTDPFNGMSDIPRTVAHFISGKPVLGGVAYINVLCNPNFGYGVSQVYGAFDLTDPFDIWDVMVVAHELGHNFGSPHSHCYVPELDQCFNQERGCYAGPVVASQGTIMSYCHLLSGGLSNIDLLFSAPITARVGGAVAAAPCLVSPSTTSTSTSTSTLTSISTSTSTSTSVTTSTSSTSSTSSTTSTTIGVSTLCPCDFPWGTHRRYLRCVRAAARKLWRTDARMRRRQMGQARLSDCGR